MTAPAIMPRPGSRRAPGSRWREGYVERDGVRVFWERYGADDPADADGPADADLAHRPLAGVEVPGRRPRSPCCAC